jgi:hypothetical protein
MRVYCEVEPIELENDQGHSVESVKVICSRCEYETESFGTTENSIKRCLALMNEQCPQGEDNYYVTEELMATEA